jgi:hypothetical protein
MHFILCFWRRLKKLCKSRIASSEKQVGDLFTSHNQWLLPLVFPFTTALEVLRTEHWQYKLQQVVKHSQMLAKVYVIFGWFAFMIATQVHSKQQ